MKKSKKYYKNKLQRKYYKEITNVVRNSDDETMKSTFQHVNKDISAKYKIHDRNFYTADYYYRYSKSNLRSWSLFKKKKQNLKKKRTQNKIDYGEFYFDKASKRKETLSVNIDYKEAIYSEEFEDKMEKIIRYEE